MKRIKKWFIVMVVSFKLLFGIVEMRVEPLTNNIVIIEKVKEDE